MERIGAYMRYDKLKYKHTTIEYFTPAQLNNSINARFL